MGYIKKITFFLLAVIFLALNLVSCSDLFENPIPFPGHLDIEEEPKYDLDNDVVTNQDKSPGSLEKDNITSLFEIQKQYQEDCHKIEYFFCPPSLFLNEIWEFELIIEINSSLSRTVFRSNRIKLPLIWMFTI